jgi:hypothetical protein
MDEVENTYVGYHGTDKSCADDIIKNGYIPKPNNEHWLGEGVYFYIDKQLADWWTSKPSNKFGVEITNPVVIETVIKCFPETCLDMRTLCVYSFLCKKHQEFVSLTYSKIRKTKRVQDPKQLRCAFFNYIKNTENKNVIIGVFQNYGGDYLKNKLPEEYHMPYCETQICVSDSKCLRDSHII